MQNTRLMFVLCALGATTLFAGCGKKSTQPAAAPEAGSTGAAAPLQVGLLLETYDVNRWARDEAFFKQACESLGVEVMSAVADADQDRQNKQAETFLTRGADVLVVVPKNLETASRIIKVAHQKRVPVVAYDRLILNCDLDVYITFDNEKVGYLQARGILEKVPEGNFILLGGAASDNNARLFRNGQLKAIADHESKTGKKINILADPFLENWDRDEARRRISTLLARFKAEGLTVHAIIASNDSTAGGAIAALKAEQLAGKVAISGQDAELTACQRIVEGTQTLTVYKPIEALATTAAHVAVRLARGEDAEAIIRDLGYEIQTLDNGTKEVPSIFLEPVFVTADNMADTVVADNWHPAEKIYANVPRDQWPD